MSCGTHACGNPCCIPEAEFVRCSLTHTLALPTSDGDGLDDATGGDARCSTVTNLECVYAMRNFTLNGTDCAEGLLDVGGVVRNQKTPFLMRSFFTFI